MKEKEIILSLLRNALMGEPLGLSLFEGVGDDVWKRVYDLARRQGVLAICFDGVKGLPKAVRPFHSLFIKWALASEDREKRYGRQRFLAYELADEFKRRGLSTVVLKGLAFSGYYPVPEHRECGDFDCFLMGDYARGNEVAMELGCVVNDSWYKHSDFLYKGLEVENHQMLVCTRGGERYRRLNDELVGCMMDGARDLDEGACLMVPGVDFNLRFQTYHSFSHFISEGVALRHLCDWALFVGREQENIDWAGFYGFCRRYGFERFVYAFTDLAHRYLGMEVRCGDMILDSEFSERIMEDIWAGDSRVFSSGKGAWFNRWLLVRNMFRDGWKHRVIAGESVVGYFFRTVWGFVWKGE